VKSFNRAVPKPAKPAKLVDVLRSLGNTTGAQPRSHCTPEEQITAVLDDGLKPFFDETGI